MSASTARTDNVTALASARGKLASPRVNAFAAFGVWLIALVAISFATYIAFNLGEWSSSFWLGVASFVVVGVLFYVPWLTHHMKNRALGYILNVLTFIVVGVVIVLSVNFVTTFAWSKFGWGVLYTALLIVVLAVVALFGSLSRRAPSNR